MRPGNIPPPTETPSAERAGSALALRRYGNGGRPAHEARVVLVKAVGQQVHVLRRPARGGTLAALWAFRDAKIQRSLLQGTRWQVTLKHRVLILRRIVLLLNAPERFRLEVASRWLASELATRCLFFCLLCKHHAGAKQGNHTYA